MYQFVEKEPVRKRHMRYDHIGESNCGHLAKIWQIPETHFRQHWIKRRVCDPERVEVDDSDAVEQMPFAVPESMGHTAQEIYRAWQ
jgi:hypothetical protein